MISSDVSSENPTCFQITPAIRLPLPFGNNVCNNKGIVTSATAAELLPVPNLTSVRSAKFAVIAFGLLLVADDILGFLNFLGYKGSKFGLDFVLGIAVNGSFLNIIHDKDIGFLVRIYGN